MSYTDEDDLHFKICEKDQVLDRWMENYGTYDLKTVKIVYPHIKDDKDKSYVERLDEYIDELDNRYDIYDLTENLHLETDSTSDAPSNLLCFKNLKTINLFGSRFSNINMDCLPNTVEEIGVSGSNLDGFLYNGLYKKQNLKKLWVDCDDFGFDDVSSSNNKACERFDDVFPLDDILTLGKIVITTSHCWNDKDIKEDYAEIIKNNSLFAEIKYRIIRVDHISGHDRAFEVILATINDENIGDIVEVYDLCGNCYESSKTKMKYTDNSAYAFCTECMCFSYKCSLNDNEDDDDDDDE
jgi:hypothetical protein